VITPQHTSSVGVTALNGALQARLNPARPGVPEVAVTSEVVFRLGDRVIVGKNNYQTLCFNGETGEIVDLGPQRLTLRMEDAQGERLVDYDRDDWSQLQLAYAITSHRAQGSEWDNVVVVVSQSHYMMLQRNLLYTALTRAKRRAVIVVSGGLQNKQTGAVFKTALEVAVGNDRIAHRYSGLAERLVALVSEVRSPITSAYIRSGSAADGRRRDAQFWSLPSQTQVRLAAVATRRNSMTRHVAHSPTDALGVSRTSPRAHPSGRDGTRLSMRSPCS
jgi:hypothetical protein